MNIEFDWQAENEEGEWETIATIIRKRRGYRGTWRVWAALIVAALVLTAGTTVGLRRQYGKALRRIEFQIQSVIDLEARALAQGNRALFLAQQDRASALWYGQQAACLRLHSQCDSAALTFAPPSSTDTPLDDYAPIASAQLQTVDMRGDVAWVEVALGENALRQARFYRQTDLGWVHTAPQAEFFGEPVEMAYGPVTVLAHQRDLPHLETLAGHILQTVEDLGARLGAPPDGALVIEFAPGPSSHPLPHLSGDKLTLASPWLSGIPSQGAWDRAYLEELTYWVAYGVASRFMRSSGEVDLGEHQQAILGEYVDFYAHQDLARTPILSRVVERHGVDVLPEALSSTRYQRSIFDFMDRWLYAQRPQQHGTYFETLWQIRQVVDCTAQQATCRLFRVLDRDYRWLGGGLGWNNPRSWPLAVIY